MRNEEESGKKYEIKYKMLFFDMSDFMGNDHLELVGFQQMQQGIGNQNIAKFFYQPHNAGCNHLSAEYRPAQDIVIFQTGPGAKVLSTIACATAPLSVEVPGLAITLFLLGLGWNFGFVAGSALLDDVLRTSEKGRYQGSVDTLVKLASGAGSLGSGLLFASAGFALTSWGTILAAIFPALLLLMLGTMSQPEPLAETASS